MDPGSGSLELPRDGSRPMPVSTPVAHHLVVGPKDADLLDDPRAGSSPTLIRDPLDIEPRDAAADLGSSTTLVRDPLDMERPDPDPSLLRQWLPYLVAAGLIAMLVLTCAALP